MLQIFTFFPAGEIWPASVVIPQNSDGMQNLDEEDNKEPVGDVNDVAAVGPLLQLLPLQDGTDHVPCVEH